MTRLIATLFLMPLVTFAESEDSHPFTPDLAKIDEGISGEYSYNWSIGVNR